MKPGTGEILGMVGSVDYYNTAIDGQVNVADFLAFLSAYAAG